MKKVYVLATRFMNGTVTMHHENEIPILNEYKQTKKE